VSLASLVTPVVAVSLTDPETVLFIVLGAVALGSAVAVVTLRNIVHGALLLVVHFLAIAGLYLALQSSFLAIIQVMVYAGAIMVLFLFVIMLLGVDRDDLLVPGGLRTPVAAAAVGLLLAGALTAAFVGPYTGPASVCGSAAAPVGVEQPCVGLDALLEDDPSGVAAIGRRLFTRHVLPFEIAALLLTVATVGAVVLARRRDDAPEELVLTTADRGTTADADVDADAGTGTGEA
jgi:NADH-quinone oxidoreductase subunit J